MYLLCLKRLIRAEEGNGFHIITITNTTVRCCWDHFQSDLMMETLTANQNTTVNYRAVSSNNVSNSTILLKRRLGCKSDLKEDILPETYSYDLQDN